MPKLIDADALMTNVCGKECGCNLSDCELECDNPDTRCVFREYVEVQPTIEAEPVRHGRWLNRKRNGYAVLVCSECEREKEGYTRTAYCPHCGVKMDGGAEK